MLSRWTGNGLFVTSAVAGAGKTVVAGAIAQVMAQQVRVGALKPIDTKSVHRREGLISEDAEILAYRGDVRFPLDVICPIRSRNTLPRSLTGEFIEWSLIRQSLSLMNGQVDALVVEGVGGIMTPLDLQYTNLDIARWLDLPVVIVVHPGEEALNQILSCAEISRGAQLTVAGVVINRYDPETASSAEEKMLSVIERSAGARLLAVFPDEPASQGLSGGIVDAASRVDWLAMSQHPLKAQLPTGQ